ncbi:MAG: signal recognition particle protein [Nitrospirae bacterium]|nr:signal recognition particle protein [Nitrospirota bacterium]
MLSDKLEKVFKKLKGRGVLNEKDVDEGLKEVRMALLEADVNFKVVKDFVQSVRDKSVGSGVLDSLTPGQQVVKIVYNELVGLMGETVTRIALVPNRPTVLMMVGLQGSGKTTTTGKLGRMFKKGGRKVLLVAADTQRPAAIDQLVTLGKQLNIDVEASEPGDDPVEVCKRGLERANRGAYGVVILDTAGRLHIDDALMDQLSGVKAAVKPDEILFVADSMTGQDAVKVAKSFDEKLDIAGVILTKMDGDARGGAALSIRAVTGKPIKFVGMGEKLDAIEPFFPDRVASRILGMGDVLSLIEKAEQSVNVEEAKALEAKVKQGDFSLEDFRTQILQVKKLGPLDQLLGMLPGMGKLKGAMSQVDEREVDRIVAIINSMTMKERNNVNLINGNRRKRIAKGSGTQVPEVNRLLKQFAETRKMMKMLTKTGGKLRMGRGMMPF